jgi:putative intracellular protease/amidase
MSNILIVLSAASTWVRSDGSEYPTGFWAEELMVPYRRFVEAGHTVHFATPGGVTPTLDPHSVDPAVVGDAAGPLQAEVDAIADQLGEPLQLSGIDIAGYDAVFVPGGHAPMVDLFQDRDLGHLLADALDADKVVASVCHGPAALLSATRDDGTWLLSGRHLAVVTDDEERAFGTADKAPWLLASRLREYGAVVEGGPNWQAFVVQDGRLISGQNPASAGRVADAILAEIAAENAPADNRPSQDASVIEEPRP